MPYPEIRIWDFPPTRTYLRINANFRENFIRRFISFFRTNIDAVEYLNSKSKKYGNVKSYSSGQTATWIKGSVKTNNRVVHIPLWVVLEMSKIIAKTENDYNLVMQELEANIEYYCGQGFSTHVHGKFPMRLTPELVSVVFHLCGDGFFANTIGKSSSYRQVNAEGLINFRQKLLNSFGNFETDTNEIKDFKTPIPRVISDFYMNYFELGDLRWDIARIPEKIKRMGKGYLVTGLTSFIIDEGHIGDNIEIYSGNLKLLEDIRDIADTIGYICNGPRVKSKTNTKEFRLYISLKSVIAFSNDIKEIEKEFPTCNLAHKQELFNRIVKRNNPTLKREKNGVTKQKILTLLSEKQMSALELCCHIAIAPSSLKEHLLDLEKEGKIDRIILDKLSRPYWKKSEILL